MKRRREKSGKKSEQKELGKENSDCPYLYGL